MARTLIRFPKLYSRAISLLNVELKPSHFFDLLVLSLVAGAFVTSAMTMGVVSQKNSDVSPRLLIAALALHAMAQVMRAKIGVRIRWTGLAFLPLALWVLFDKGSDGVAWIGREQASVGLCATAAFWITLHHLRHPAHRWFLFGVAGATAAVFGALMISSDKNLLPKMAGHASDASLYADRMTGPFGTPGLFAAFLMLCLFPIAAVMISPTHVPARRIAAGLAVAFGMIGLAGARHNPAWIGFCLGAALLSLLLVGLRAKAVVTSAVFVGLAFLAPKFGFWDSGLFRADKLTEKLSVAPLPDASAKLFLAHPLTGVGSGGFASAFETVRPAAWSIDPRTAGGFFHQLAAENGVVGLALFIVPAAGLWILALRLCLRTPRRETPRRRTGESTFHDRIPKPRPPEIRVALAGLLSGTLAAGVVLAFDYPGPSTTLAIGFAIVAAIVARLIESDRLITTVAPREKPLMPLRIAIAAIPVLAFAVYIPSVFESAQSAAFAEALVADANVAAQADRKALVVSRYRLDAVAMAEYAARGALTRFPDNARAASALADAHLSRLRFSGKDDYFGEALGSGRIAFAVSGNEVRPSLPLVAALRAAGDKSGAEHLLRELHRRAPRNTPLTLELARTTLEKGDTRETLGLAAEVLLAEPWNREAKRIGELARMTP